MNITAAMVKELRDMTGAGMMAAKNALVEVEGDMEKAMEVLRQKGIASAAKKMGRIAAEGRIASYVDDNCGAMLELNCETDFVAKNQEFIELANGLAELAAKSAPADIAGLESLVCPKCGKIVSEIIKEKIASVGEKITLRKFIRYEGNISTYIHNGKIGVLLKTSAKDIELCKDICLHIASSAPEFIARTEIPASVMEEERRIESGKEDLAKKPEAIREKIVEGRVNKLMSQKCLLEQPFVKNPDITIEQLISGKLSIIKFTRYVLGEGLEKRSDNFAEEVMGQLKK